MKRLIVLRHGKAERPVSGRSDFDRELTQRGHDDATRVGEVLFERRLTPDSIISSSAKRAITTAQRVAENCGFKPDVNVRADLYSAGIVAILNVIRTSIPSDATTALIVGHNPGLEYLIELFSLTYRSLPPAGWALINLKIENWSDVDRNTESDMPDLWIPGSV